jgi:hypothetical protein
LPVYAILVGTSALLYLARGRPDIVRALGRGALAGLCAALGGRVTPVGAPVREP